MFIYNAYDILSYMESVSFNLNFNSPLPEHLKSGKI